MSSTELTLTPDEIKVPMMEIALLTSNGSLCVSYAYLLESQKKAVDFLVNNYPVQKVDNVIVLNFGMYNEATLTIIRYTRGDFIKVSSTWECGDKPYIN